MRVEQDELQVLEQYEVTQARSLRAFCNHCGHRWRPRNPSPTVNRCPGCLHRGKVDYTRHGAARAVALAEPGEGLARADS